MDKGASVTGATGEAEVVLPCPDLRATIDFLRARLGFRLDRIGPADEPREAALSGHGLRLLLRRDAAGPPGALRLACEDPARLGGGERILRAPNGLLIELAPRERPLDVPPLRSELVLSRAAGAHWVEGRAGMRYRDLIPGRLGGRFIASLIRIPGAGPVPDDVHFHAIRAQLIACLHGRVRVVYEDQGPPFWLEVGDCVLQPPRIRHRVLESAGDLEVLELACPAEHDTYLDHDLALPTAEPRPEREFGGQRFVHHVAREAEWRVLDGGLEERDLGLTAASGGLVRARALRATKPGASLPLRHDGEFLLAHVLAGAFQSTGVEREPVHLVPGDALTVPPGRDVTVLARDGGAQLLLVSATAG